MSYIKVLWEKIDSSYFNKINLNIIKIIPINTEHKHSYSEPLIFLKVYLYLSSQGYYLELKSSSS